MRFDSSYGHHRFDWFLMVMWTAGSIVTRYAWQCSLCNHPMKLYFSQWKPHQKVATDKSRTLFVNGSPLGWVMELPNGWKTPLGRSPPTLEVELRLQVWFSPSVCLFEVQQIGKFRCKTFKQVFASISITSIVKLSLGADVALLFLVTMDGTPQVPGVGSVYKPYVKSIRTSLWQNW